MRGLAVAFSFVTEKGAGVRMDKNAPTVGSTVGEKRVNGCEESNWRGQKWGQNLATSVSLPLVDQAGGKVRGRGLLPVKTRINGLCLRT